MKFSFKKAGSVAAMAAVVALVATGCSSGGGGSETDLAEVEELTEMTKISVAALPIAPTAAIILGIDEGIFEKHNLEVDLTTGQGGAAILPAVAQGQVNFAIGQPLPIILAASKGIDVKIIGNYSAAYAEGDDINGVAALDPAIASAKDLEGKRVAVNTLQAAGDLTIREAIEQDGGDPSNVDWVEVPFPEMQAQLTGGAIDAAWLPEPFLSKTIAEGGNLVTYNYQDTIPGLTTLVGFTSGAYMEENPAVVKAFQDALAETRELANEDVAAARAVLPEFLGMPPAAAENLKMEDFGPELNVDSIQKLQELMVKYEFMDEEIDLDDLIVE